MHHDPLPADLLDVAQTLERQRPRLDGLELDELKRRSMRASRTTAPSTHKGPFMRTRLAIMTLLASGLILSGGGTALGVVALQAKDDAGVAQYGSPDTAPGQVLGETASGDDTPDAPDVAGTAGSGGGGGGDVLGTTARGGTDIQATRQIATAPGGSLPFTGYAAIPVLLLGLAMVGAGLVLRRRPQQS